ncbi:MAG: dTMP kinase [Saccharofermentanales bacterium]
MKGLFITFEGIDGCGKSTQIELFRKKIEQVGYDHILIREPGGTTIGENIREILLDKVNTGMRAETELLLFEAARAQNVREVIIPALADGKLVLCDRFADSSLAYQGYGRQLGADVVTALNDYATGGIRPDLTFFMDITPETARDRLSVRRRESDRLDAENLDFMHRARAGYLAIAEADPDRVRIINATNEKFENAEEIYRIFREVIQYETGLCNC